MNRADRVNVIIAYGLLSVIFGEMLLRGLVLWRTGALPTEGQIVGLVIGGLLGFLKQPHGGEPPRMDVANVETMRVTQQAPQEIPAP